MHVCVSVHYPPSRTSARCAAQHVATPTMNFREENFRDQKSNHEIHEDIVPRKFGAIRYVCCVHNSEISTLEGLKSMAIQLLNFRRSCIH